MVVTRTCERCGDSLVIETLVRGTTRPVLIESLPAHIESDGGELFDPSSGECWTWLYGMIAVPKEIHRPAWVVAQSTMIHELKDHRLHRAHVCRESEHVPTELREAVTA